MKTKEILWGIWFIVSLVLAVSLMLIMTLEGSIQVKELPYLLGLCLLQVLIVSYIGTIKTEVD